MLMEIESVAAFHDKMGVSSKQLLSTKKNKALAAVAKQLLDASAVLEKKVADDDRRYLRAHLMVEELGELLQAMADGDEVATLDGMSDLCYVIFGSAVTMDLPLADAFAEVHRSNMTKEKQPDDPSKERVRQKGPNFQPPRIKELIERYRARQQSGFKFAKSMPIPMLSHSVEEYMWFRELTPSQQELVKGVASHMCDSPETEQKIEDSLRSLKKELNLG